VNFAETVSLYDLAIRATATRETATFAIGARFATEVRHLKRELEGFEEDETWGAFARRCRRTLWDLNITPLPPADAAFGLADSVAYLTELTVQMRGSYPDRLIARGELCIAALRDLIVFSANPLGSLAVSVLETGDLAKSGLVVRSRYVEEVDSWLQEAVSQVRLVTVGQLATLTGLETLVIIGPSCFYPAHVLGAPRAELICFVHFDWIRDSDPDTRLFARSGPSIGARIRSAPSAQPTSDDESLDAYLLVPMVDWNALERTMGAHRAGSAEDPDFVDASVFLLAGGYSVCLETVDGSSIEVVDVEAEAKRRLRTERTDAIDIGSYIVLRSEGGSGDYIPEVADRHLGRRAVRLRALQVSWKRALRDKIRAFGFARVNRDLRSRGIKSPNLRYRLWHRSIRTQNPTDFKILMTYLGLESRADELWVAMGEINDAHMWAGQAVRRSLEDGVKASDLEQLLQTGRVDVRLTDLDAGTLSVLKVVGRAPETASVHEEDLRVLRRVEGDLWQE
jgi:hypothetical protein